MADSLLLVVILQKNSTLTWGVSSPKKIEVRKTSKYVYLSTFCVWFFFHMLCLKQIIILYHKTYKNKSQLQSIWLNLWEPTAKEKNHDPIPFYIYIED